MARWDNVLKERSRLLLDADALEISREVVVESDLTVADDEGHDTQIQLHRRWHFPRALRWWTRRGDHIQLAS